MPVDEYLRMVCKRLAQMTTAGTVRPDTLFRPASRKKTFDELDRGAELALALANHAQSGMHAPAIEIWANAGVARGDLIRLMSRIAECRHADLKHIPQTIGRGKQQSSQKAMLIGKQLYADYAALTGTQPAMRVVNDKAAGPFFQLIRQVFDILQIDASAEYVARETIKEKRGSKRKR